jgi:hypothetical protein
MISMSGITFEKISEPGKFYILTWVPINPFACQLFFGKVWLIYRDCYFTSNVSSPKGSGQRNYSD